MKTLIIARHGNTFRPGETPTRVGAHTDLPLVEEERARGIGRYLRDVKNIIPTRILAAPLQRTLRTAQLAAEELGNPAPVIPDARFVEVDYGPDENKTEAEVMARLGRIACEAQGKTPESLTPEQLEALGAKAIELWNSQAIAPHGWQVDVPAIISAWQQLAAEVAEGDTVLCVSSNGVIRFAPHITGDYAGFCAEHDIKVPTGGLCIFTSADGGATWQCREWGVKAFKKASPNN